MFCIFVCFVISSLQQIKNVIKPDICTDLQVGPGACSGCVHTSWLSSCRAPCETAPSSITGHSPVSLALLRERRRQSTSRENSCGPAH